MLLKSLPFAVLAFLLVLISTPWGLGLRPDSIIYVEVARALVEKGDFMALPSHWPPFYPLLLTGFQILTSELTLGARLLQALLMGGNVFLIAVLLRNSNLDRGLSALFLLLVLLQPGFVEVHIYLWTEPTFLCLALLNILVLERIMRQPASFRLLLLLAVIAGLSIMVRYAGLFLVMVNGLALIFFSHPPSSATVSVRWQDRSFLGIRLGNVADALIVTAVTLIPMLAWSIFNRMRGVGTTNREFFWHPIGLQHLKQATSTLADWFHVPAGLGWLILILVLLSALWGLWQTSNRGRQQEPMPRLLGLYLLVYMFFLVISISIFDFYTPLDTRILIPIFPAIIVLLMYFIGQASRQAVRVILSGAIVVGLILNIPHTYNLLRESQSNGLGFADKKIQEMEIMKALRGLPPSWKIRTNTPEFFRLYLDQSGTMLPRKFNAATQRANPKFADEVQTMLKNSDALVYFSSVSFRTYLPSPQEIHELPEFRLVYAKPDGLIWVQHKHIQ